jgi:hypothetical protein
MTPIQILEHSFTSTIRSILSKNYGADSELIFKSSHILAYLNLKTKSANQGSKARGAFANHYALYVVIEDYIKNGFDKTDTSLKYSNYEGARFSDLFVRQRQLPFGSKLQNHALNARLNDEFEKFFPTLGKAPIVRDVEKQRYWVQEDLLNVTIRNSKGEDIVFNIASSILEIIDAYVATKLEAFEGFIDTCKQISELATSDSQKAIDFVIQQLQPNVDARIFEIVSFAVLKAKYGLDTVWIGDSKDEVEEEELILYKTGRTNANDGGIDFVMKPLGRFFQVTETVDVTKYFLDIDKVQRFPITFVVKSNDSEEVIKNNIKLQALSKYKIASVVDSYMLAVEEVINVIKLIDYFTSVVKLGKVTEVMSEIVRQSKVEFNYEDED